MPPVHVVLALLTYALLPCVAAYAFVRCWRQHGRMITVHDRMAALLLAGVLSYPVTMVVWISGCFAVGLISGVMTGDVTGALQSAFKMAVPLEINRKCHSVWALVSIICLDSYNDHSLFSRTEKGPACAFSDARRKLMSKEAGDNKRLRTTKG